MDDPGHFEQKRIKVYILDPSVDITGAFNCARNEARLLRKYIEFTIVLPADSRIGEEHLEDFKKVIRLPIVNLRRSFFSVIAYIPVLIFSGWQLSRHLKKDGCDHLQVNDFYLMQGVIARLFGFRGNIVTWVRMDPRRFGSFLSRIWLALTFRYSDHVIAVSRFIRGLLPGSPKIVLVRDPVFVRDVSQTAAESPPGEGVKNLVYISNYIRGKGQEYAILLLSELEREYSDLHLHFYGGDMGLDKNLAYRRQLEEQANAGPCAGQIHFHGFVDDIGAVLKGAFAALNFSESESFSLSCLEAGYYGVPVIATRSGGPEEIVINGRTGFLVRKKDIQAMQVALLKLLRDENLAKQMGAESAAYVKEEFSHKKFVRNVLIVYGIEGHDDGCE